jgi:hypothetical protein
VSRSYFTRLIRLSYLAPDITQAILDGRQPRDLTADKLLAHSRLPLTWDAQRRVLGFRLTGLSQEQLPLGKSCDLLEPHHWLCGTGIWPRRDIVAGRRHIAGLCPSLPTAPSLMARTPARKAGILDLGALLPVRDGLSAGGRWIRTVSTAHDERSIRESFQEAVAGSGQVSRIA